jgi:hypothetical protein
MNADLLTQCAIANDKRLASDMKKIAEMLDSGEIGAQDAMCEFEIASKEHLSRCKAVVSLFA